MSDAVIYAWREEQGDVWTGEWALERKDKWVPAEAQEYVLATPSALSSHPEVMRLVAEAEARGRNENDAYALALEQELRDRANPPKMSESDFDCLILDALAEAMKAMRKFPQPNYVISKIAEEAGEVVKAAIHCAEGRETAENLRGEMKQLIAMIYRLWVEGDQVHGLPPVSAAIRAKDTP